MWETSCGVTFGNISSCDFLTGTFGAEIGAEVPETPKCSVAHWGPLAWCLEKDPEQPGQPVQGTVGAN